MGKYDPLRRYLASKSADEVSFIMSFSDIEHRVGQLPQSAREGQAWWTSNRSASRGAHTWLPASWRITQVDSDSEQVTFTREPVVEKSFPSTPDTVVGSEAEGDGSSSTSSRRSPRRAIVGDIGAPIVAAGAAGASELVGVAHLPWPALLSLAIGVGAIAWTMNQAIQDRKSPERASWWWAVTTSLLLALTVGASGYHKIFDPAVRQHRTYEFVVNGDENNFIPLYGEPGSPEQKLATGDADQNALIGGQGYFFDCWTAGPTGTEWFRYERFNQTWWAPRKYLHLPFGVVEPPIRHC